MTINYIGSPASPMAANMLINGENDIRYQFVNDYMRFSTF